MLVFQGKATIMNSHYVSHQCLGETMYHLLEPEVSGSIGEGTVITNYDSIPQEVSVLEYYFETWFGDDLVEGHPCWIVTDKLMRKLRQFAGTGFSFAKVTVTRSEDFEEINEGVVLPRFHWLKVNGVGGVDDFGLSHKGQLVVSDRALEVLRSCILEQCRIRKFVAKSPSESK